MRRSAFVLLGVALLAALSGCSAIFGPGEPDPAALNANQTYDWNTGANTSITLERNSFRAVVSTHNRTSVELYRWESLGRERYLHVEAVRYRFDNGTVVNASSAALTVNRTRYRTRLYVPNETGGAVAFRAPRHGKQFITPTFSDGSHELTLPPMARVGIPVLSHVNPGNYTTSVEEGRQTIRWETMDHDTIDVRWYLQRDVWIFGSLIVLAVAIGGGGALYTYRQIRQIAKRREELGVDVDMDEDDPRDRGPPPGMR